MVNKPMVLTRERRPITSVELRGNITGEIGQVEVLIPDDQGAFKGISIKIVR